MVEISSQKYLFLLQVDHCPQFLFAQVSAEITFLFHTLFYFSPSYSDQEVEGETKQKLLICIFYDQLFLQRKHRYNGYRFTWVYRKDKTLLQFCLARIFLYHRPFLDPWMVDLSYSELFCEINSLATHQPPQHFDKLCSVINPKLCNSKWDGWDILVMISKSCLFFFFFFFFCENHFLLNFHLSLNIFLQSRSKFQTSLRQYIFPLLVRDSIFANFARKIAVRFRKCHLSSL